MKRSVLIVFVAVFLLQPGDSRVGAQAPPDALTFFKNYFVTGDYVAAGIGLRGKGVDGLATDAIQVQGVPPGADILAAFLYWQVVSNTGSDTGSVGARFKGYDLTAPDGQPFGKALAIAGTAPCYNPGGSTGTGSQATWTYRADVLRFFSVDQDPASPTFGKFQINGTHQVTVPDSGPNGNQSPMALGAGLVVIYRDPSLPLNAIVLYDDGVTLDNAQRTVVQSIQGFYQPSATPNAKISYLVGSGQPNKHEQIWFPGGTVASPFSASDGDSWDTRTYPVGLGGNPTSVTEVTTTVSNDVQTPGGRDCLTVAAMVFKTAVQDTDGDGLLDIWESSTTTLLDPLGRALPNLNAMGADPALPDLFIETGYMKNDVETPYGGVPKPAHSHLPPHAALKRVGDAFKGSGPADRIRVHFDMGPDYPLGDPADAAHNAEEYLVPRGLARGGESIDESATVCTPGPGAPVWECQFSLHPGTVGWKSGFRFLRDEVLAVTPPPPPTNPPTPLEDYCGVAGYTCHRRFDDTRTHMFHYALFAHALGLPKSELPCLDGATPVPAGADDRCVAGTTVNPDFLTPRTNTGIGDFPGGDLMVTLGGFPDLEGKPVGTPFMQASTLMHELGHNFERRHGGEAFEPNCKPTYLSAMNYLYQLRGLLDDSGTPHLDFAGAPVGATVDETALNALVASPPFRLGWYAPLVGSYREGRAAPALRHCNGSDLLPGDPAMVRVDARRAADPIDWDANGLPGFASSLDVNFNGAANEVLAGSDDWSNLRLNQIGSRRNVGGLFVDPLTGSLVVGPLSVDVGKGDLGKGDLGKGDLGKGDLGKGDLGKGDLGKGDLGKGDLGKGDLGKGDLGGGDLFLNDPNNPSGELDAETAGDLARTPPNQFQACVSGANCSPSTAPLHQVQLSWTASNTGGDVSAYRAYRVEGGTLQQQPWTQVGADVPAVSGQVGYATVDTTPLVNGAEYTYFAVAVHTDGSESDLSNLVTIVAVNDPPVAANDSYSTLAGTPLVVAAPGVLANDADLDTPGPLTAVLASGPSNGTVTLNANGSFTYTPNAGFSGQDTFTYRAFSGLVGSNLATVTITVRSYTFVGLQNVPPPVGKTFKAGSSIPMKWQFADGSTVVNSAQVVHTVRVVGPCPTATPCSGAGTRTITNTDPGGSSFRYSDPVWTFNLQTKDANGAAYPVGFYQVTITPGTAGFAPSPTFVIQLVK